MIEHIELLVEEPSAEAALRALLPRFLANVTFDVHPYGGKHDLLGRLPQRLKGYTRWLPENWRIVVLVDCDDEACHTLKARLEHIAAEANLVSRTQSPDNFVVVNRVAIEELEAWYFGDWEAVREVYPRVSATVPAKSGYRDPDAIAGGTWEAFERVLQAGGYMKGGLRKLEAARMLGERLMPERNASRSFRAFWRAITEA